MLPYNQGIIIPCFNEQEYKRLDTVKDIYFEKTDTIDKNFVNTSKKTIEKHVPVVRYFA